MQTCLEGNVLIPCASSSEIFASEFQQLKDVGGMSSCMTQPSRLNIVRRWLFAVYGLGIANATASGGVVFSASGLYRRKGGVECGLQSWLLRSG